MIDGAPQIVQFAVDLHIDLVEVPSPMCAAPHAVDALASDLRGKHRTEPVPPQPDGFVADVDPALGQQVLDVAQRQGVADIHLHHQPDDLRRTIKVSEGVLHQPTVAPEPAKSNLS